MSKEPDRLKRGKEFHLLVQSEWEQEATGDVTREKQVLKPQGRRGRIDVHVEEDGVVAVVEVKASDWDRMTDRAVKRNIRRQIRQIWGYIESQLENSDGVSPGVIFATTPTLADRKQLIEERFSEEGIVVVWHDA